MNSNGTATTRGRSLVLVTAVTSVLGWGHLSAAEAVVAEAVEAVEATELKGLVVSLESLVGALGRNLEAQHEAWPDQERLLGEEVAPPYAVRQLQSEYAKLWRQRKRIQGRLLRESAAQVGVLLDVLKQTQSGEMARLLAPIVEQLGKDEPRASVVLRNVAERFTPCLPEVADALGSVGDRDARLFLLELGRRESNIAILRAAARFGDPAVLERCVNWIESGSDDAALILRALRQLEAPAAVDAKLPARLKSWIAESQSHDLRSQLVIYLGLLSDEENHVFLTELYENDSSVLVRHAAISALGRLGERSARFLVSELRKRTNDLQIRKACVHALGGTDFAPAVGDLIQTMKESSLRSDAARALRRLSGEDFGTDQASWRRWWNRQRAANGTATSF
jgi:hypothetical protein